jgi:hypothetical protein
MGRFVLAVLLSVLAVLTGNAAPQAQPTITINPPAPGAGYITGTTSGADTNKLKAVLFALTNQFYVQCVAAAPYTNLAIDGTWGNCTHPWSSLVVVLVDPANYTPPSTEITNPALDPGVIAWAEYPPAPAALAFSGYQWGIKITGNQPSDQFDPGNNYWSADPSVISVQADGLHLHNAQVGGNWQSAEVFLTKSLGYGTYTVQVNSDLSHLDLSTVAAPMFIYLDFHNAELDNEYSGSGGLIPVPYNAQFVAQPYTVGGNLIHYVQPATAQFTSQMEWRADHVTFRAWKGWASTPAAGDMIYEWFYTGSYIPPAGQERVHINLWLNYAPPISGIGDTMVIKAFNFHPPVYGPVVADPLSLTFNMSYDTSISLEQPINVSSTSGAVDFAATSDSPWLLVPLAVGITPTPFNVVAFPKALVPGTYKGDVTLTSGVNATKVPVALTITETGSPCDTNQSGTIDAASVQKVVNEALGVTSAKNDLNHDGVVNVVDAQIVINAVLNLGCLAQ